MTHLPKLPLCLFLAATMAAIPACREKPPEEKAETEAKPRRERPERITEAAPVSSSIRRERLAKWKQVGMGVQFMEKGRYFSRQEVEALEVDVLLEKIAAMPKDDRRGAAVDMVFVLPVTEWRKMLEFANRLPIGRDSESAVQVTGAKLAKTVPQVWTEHHALLKEKLSESQYEVAAGEFGKSMAEREKVLEEIDAALAVPEMTPEARRKFLEGLFEELQTDETALALTLLPKLSDAERVQAVRLNGRLFADAIVPGDAALAMVRDLAPAQRDKMAEALGSLFGRKGPEASRTEVEAMAARLDPPQEKSLYLAWYEDMARIDLNKTMESVPAIRSPQVRDAVVSKMVYKIRQYDKPAAVKWAETITDVKQRQFMLDALK